MEQGAPELLLAAAVELLLGPVVVVVELLLGPVVVVELLLGPVVVVLLLEAVGDPPPAVVLDEVPIVIDPPNPVLLLAGPEWVVVEVVEVPPDDGPVGSAGFAHPCDATTTIHPAATAAASFQCIMTKPPSIAPLAPGPGHETREVLFRQGACDCRVVQFKPRHPRRASSNDASQRS
jgi:hypothetical protein